MSQLLDSLRRARVSQRSTAPPTAHGDAVLATLGYAPRRRVGRSSRTVRVAIVVLVSAAIWTGWRVYYHSGAEAKLRRPSPRPPSAATGTATARVRPVKTPAASPIVAARPGGNLPPTAPALPHVAPADPVTANTTSPAVSLASHAAHQKSARSPVLHAEPPPSVAGTRADPVPIVSAPATPRPRSGADDFDLALYYHRAGDFENALQRYRALLQRNEMNAQAHNNLGLLYQERGLLPEAARELQRAVVIEPRSASAHNNYGVTLLLQGNPDEAAAQFRSVLAGDSRNVDAMVNLALAERNRNQLDLAKEMLLKALSVSPRNAPAHYNLAQLYDQTHEAARAIEHYRSFLDTAGAEHAGRAAAVRARIAELSRTPE